MLVYNYGSDGRYICSEEADESPLEPGVYLIPANATTIEPPEYDSQYIPIWNGETWDIKDISLGVPPSNDNTNNNGEKTQAEILQQTIDSQAQQIKTMQDTIDQLVLSSL
ncbi:phage tail protein [Clostridium sp. 19966]|uniref:hypothetical protein n=1 Tax=Clostridium sp. 19966 TaxID=2768166 RepID=UPI0028DF3245|nr:hypothetical protein [Clostridium sp. 19966]MDT8717744.1 phage tail protein [Clostridium sp. 19966]